MLCKRLFVWICLILGLYTSIYAQPPLDQIGEEGDLYAETKQVNQFFRRFNCEENILGERLYPGDSLYHDPPLRKNYLYSLFDGQNPYMTQDLRDAFIDQITDDNKPKYLDFHGGEWFAEVRATFKNRGKPESVILFLKLQEQPVGSKWVFEGAYVNRYRKSFTVDTASRDSFLHPLSHEISFQNMSRMFRNNTSLGAFTANGFQADHLSLLLFEVQNETLKFKQVDDVRFHFMQVDNWYFELSRFDRAGFNRGWLISKLTQIPYDKKDILKRYIFNNYQ